MKRIKSAKIPKDAQADDVAMAACRALLKLSDERRAREERTRALILAKFAVAMRS